MAEPRSPPPLRADAVGRTSVRASMTTFVRAATLPRIRAAPLPDGTPSEATTNGVSSVGAEVADVVSPLSPSASETAARSSRPRGRNSSTAASPESAEERAARPLTRMLTHLDTAERCRWSSLMMGLFYVVTVLLWPSLIVSFLGVICGATGFTACLEPYTVKKIMWVFVYLGFNVVMVAGLWWVAIDQLVVRGKDTQSVNFMYISAFILLGTLVHVRSLSAAADLVRKCQLWPVVLDVALPESWRRRPSGESFDPEPQEGGGGREEAEDERGSMGERTSSVHSFEIDVHLGRSQQPVSPVSVPSPLASPAQLGSPSSSQPFRRIADAL